MRGERHEELGVDAAEADEDEGAEAWVASTADDQLDAASRVDERLDRVALRRQALVHVGRGGRDRCVVGEAERNAACVRLVEQPERLEHDGVAELCRCRARFLDRLGGLAVPNGTPPAARSSRDSKYPSPTIGAAGEPTSDTSGAKPSPCSTSWARVATTPSMSR